MFLQIPWTNLGKSAVVVYIDRLYILAGPKTEAASTEDGTYEVIRGIESQLQQAMFMCWAAQYSPCGKCKVPIMRTCRRKLWRERQSATESTVQSWQLCGYVWPAPEQRTTLQCTVHLERSPAIVWPLEAVPSVHAYATGYNLFSILCMCAGKG